MRGKTSEDVKLLELLDPVAEAAGHEIVRLPLMGGEHPRRPQISGGSPSRDPNPQDFPPLRTTELGYMAKIKPEFDKRGVKIIGLSVDPVERHAGWAAGIKETQGFAPNSPTNGGVDDEVSKP